MSRTLFTLLIASAISVLAAQLADADDLKPSDGHRLRVSIRIIEPFVIDNTNHYSGFSIDIWDQIARRLHLDYDYVLQKNVKEQLQALRDGKADVAISSISLTAEREKEFDLTHAYYDYGLQILVRTHHPHSLLEMLESLNLSAVMQIFVMAILIAIVQAHVIYFTERSNNPRFQSGYLKGLWEGFWWMWMIIATGEYGEKDTHHPFKRLVTITFWLLGAGFIATYTATLTANLTVHDLSSNINSVADLRGSRVLTVGESAGARYLADHKVSFTKVQYIQNAFALLNENKADAVVYNGPALQYYASHDGKGKTMVVGPEFGHSSSAIALPLGSPLRKPINEMILQFYEDGTFEEISKKWFGS